MKAMAWMIVRRILRAIASWVELLAGNLFPFLVLCTPYHFFSPLISRFFFFSSVLSSVKAKNGRSHLYMSVRAGTELVCSVHIALCAP